MSDGNAVDSRGLTSSKRNMATKEPAATSFAQSEREEIKRRFRLKVTL